MKESELMKYQVFTFDPIPGSAMKHMFTTCIAAAHCK